MSESEEGVEPARSAPPRETPATSSPLGPALGASVAGDLEHLKKDLEEARRVAGESQRQLLGTSAELASLREVFDRTRQHLIRLQLSVNQLREERHRLANDAMEAEALRRKLQTVTVERDQFRQELERQRKWQG